MTELVSKILIYPAAANTFMGNRGFALEEKCLKYNCSIDVSTSQHPCFPCNVVSVRSPDVNTVVTLLESVRDLNRVQCGKMDCVILLSLIASERLFNCLKEWSREFRVSVICVRRADMLETLSLSERWIIIGEGQYSDIGLCLERMVRCSVPHPQMVYKVDYSCIPRLSVDLVRDQILRAQKKIKHLGPIDCLPEKQVLTKKKGKKKSKNKNKKQKGKIHIGEGEKLVATSAKYCPRVDELFFNSNPVIPRRPTSKHTEFGDSTTEVFVYDDSPPPLVHSPWPAC